MNYRKRLEELREEAAKKLKELENIKKDFNSTKKYSDMDLRRAENEHRMAINAYDRLQKKINDEGLSLDDDFVSV